LIGSKEMQSAGDTGQITTTYKDANGNIVKTESEPVPPGKGTRVIT
jgi:hypothetical protein